MPSSIPFSIRVAVIGSSLLFVLVSASPVAGQFNRQRIQNPTQTWSTSPPIVPDQVSGGALSDHSSMSPDSWSTPITGPAAYPQRTNAPNFAMPSGSSNSSLNQFVLPTRPSFQSNNQFDPAFQVRPNAPFVNKYRQPEIASPSIPELQANIEGRRKNSLIREPEEESILARTAPADSQNQTPFRSSNFSREGTGPALKGPVNLSGQQSEFGFVESTPQLGPEIKGIPTNQYLPRESAIPVPGSQTTAPQSRRPEMPNATQPRQIRSMPFDGNRYPLGINNGTKQVPSALATETLVAPQPSQYLPNNAPAQRSVPAPVRLRNNFPSTGTPLGNPTYFNTANPAIAGLPNYRPDLGHRMSGPTFRGRDHDSGQKFDFEEKKKDYPPFSEILATGRYFGSISVLYLQPAFQRNSSVTSFNSAPATATFASTEAFDFDYETAPRLRFGFESKYGPGFELDYWQFDQGSNVSSFTSDGTTAGEISSGMIGPGQLTRLSASNAGETISAIHSIDVETFSAMFFKEIKFPISRLNGMFGFQYASIFQSLDAQLTDAGGAVIGELRSTSDMRAYGPKFKFEYYRPVGHTKLEFVTSFGGGVLFGERDQFVTNTQNNISTNRVGADEYVLTSDFYSGIQYKKMFAEKRGFYGRLGFSYQSWIGGGTAVDAQDDFGLRGFAFEVGYNR